MKYLSPKQRIRQIRLTRRRTARRIKRNSKDWKPPRSYHAVVQNEELRAPTRIELVPENAAELAKFVAAVKDYVLVRKKRLKLDFRHTTTFSAGATLLLFAELDRVTQLSELTKPLTCKAPHLDRPREVMKQIGLFELTGDSVDVVPKRADVIFWRATKGSDQNGGTYGPLLESVATAVNKSHTEAIEQNGVWQGVSEAVNNTTDHAYDGERGDGFTHADRTRWWMFTQVRDDTFTIAVCDLGIGYKRSTPKSIPSAFIEKIGSTLLGYNLDARAIQAAMQYGISRTDEKNRGKGSRDALSVLTRHGIGELTIFSNAGGVQYKLDRNQTEPRIHAFDLNLNIMGTLVWWKLPLGSVRT